MTLEEAMAPITEEQWRDVVASWGMILDAIPRVKYRAVTNDAIRVESFLRHLWAHYQSTKVQESGKGKT